VNVVEPAPAEKRVQTRPLQLQRTGLGVVTGLGILLLLILTLWWWEKGQGEQPLPELNKGAQAQSDDALRFTEVEQ
jgi:hypothetical protein